VFFTYTDIHAKKERICSAHWSEPELSFGDGARKGANRRRDPFENQSAVWQIDRVVANWRPLASALANQRSQILILDLSNVLVICYGKLPNSLDQSLFSDRLTRDVGSAIMSPSFRPGWRKKSRGGPT